MSLPAHLDSLRAAVEHGGFNDAAETERVSRWALEEIERLRNVVAWFESEHGIDDDRVREFYALLRGTHVPS